SCPSSSRTSSLQHRSGPFCCSSRRRHTRWPRDWSSDVCSSDLRELVRLRLLVAIDHPQIVGFDQDEFARRLHYDRPIEASLDARSEERREGKSVDLGCRRNKK